MSEPVLISPATRRNSDGDPVAGSGVPFTAWARVAPGNTAERRGANGELESADWTLYLPPRVRVGDTYLATAEALTDQFTVAVRGKPCRGRVQSWSEGGRGGVVVLASSRTGKS